HGQLTLRPFKRKQKRLRLKPASKTRELASRANHPVTRRNDGNRILPIGRAHGTHRIRSANLAGNLRVRARFTVRNGEQRRPHLALELAAIKVERQVERLAAALEVLAKLALRLEQDGVIDTPNQLTEPNAGGVIVLPQDRRKSGVACDQLQRADRGVDLFAEPG